MNIQNTILIIKKQLSIVDLIPKNFEPVKTPIGIDRDYLESLISEFQNNCLNISENQFISELNSFKTTLDDYIELFTSEIKSLHMIQYTNPNSVHLIMDHIGTKGVLNTDQGLCIFSNNHDLKLNKTDFLVISNDNYYVITNTEKLTYDNFLKIID